MASKFTKQDKLLKEDKPRNVVSAEFKVGDHILCYEPDTTKAKMLYEAKVLETDVTKDDRGRKVPEYFIHFIGWNKSWDRWVLSESVLVDCDVNRQLQKALYEKATGRKKNLKIQSQKLDNDSDSIETISQSNQSTAYSSHAEGDQSHELPFLSINIPNILKTKLEDDCYYIKRKKKLLKLPRKPNAVEILGDYLKHCIINDSSDSHGSAPSGKGINIEVVREVVEGLLTYLNFTLSTLLLYNFEKEQYDAWFANERRSARDNDLKVEASESGSIALQSKGSDANLSYSKRKLAGCKQLPESTWRLSGNTVSDHASEVDISSLSSSCEAKTVHPVQKKRGRPSRKHKIDAPVPNGHRIVPRRKTRATVQLFEHRNRGQARNETNADNEEGVKRLCIISKTAENARDVEEGSEKKAFQVIGNSDEGKEISKTDTYLHEETECSEKDSGLSTRSLRPRRPISAQMPMSMQMVPSEYIPEQYNLPIGASACSMELSKTVAKNVKDQQQHGSDSRESSFVSFPLSQSNSKSPAEIYGVEHLLRLIVKVPSIISRSELDLRKQGILIEYLEMFLRYIAERAHGLFDKEHYSESVI